jgi:hypothetical protein
MLLRPIEGRLVHHPSAEAGDKFHASDPADGVTGRQARRHDEDGEQWALRKPSENVHERSRLASWAMCRRLSPIQGPSAW